jgi:ribosomal 30S subunit maturation factor RimM
VGTVQDILETGGEAPVLSVRSAGTETLIPLADAFVREVDLARGRIVVVRPEYLEAAR